MDVRGQIFCRVEQSQKSLSAHTGDRFASPVPWGDLFIPRTFVVGPDRLLTRF